MPHTSTKMFRTLIGIFAFLLPAGFAGFEWYPSLVHLEPTYKEAQQICGSITVGMTYDDLKNKVSNLFVPGPSTYIDENGTGQVWLTNNVTNLDTNCQIKLSNGKVITSEMVDVWL
jgi:hypothetical protein